MALRKWLDANDSRSITQLTRYTDSKKGDRWAGYYYSFYLDPDAFTIQVNYKSVTENQARIAELDSSGQSIFHRLLFYTLTYPSEYKNDYFILKRDVANLQNVEDWSWKNAQEYHEALVKSGVAKLAPQRAEENHNELIKATLIPYTNKEDTTAEQKIQNNAAFMRAMTWADNDGNIPLFYGYQSNIPVSSLSLLINRVEILSPEQKQQLLSQPNETGKTILHLMVERWGDIHFDVKKFGADSIRKTLCKLDSNNNTVLHSALSRKKTSLKVIQSLCQTVRLQQAEEKEFSIPALFGQNLQGLTPFHLICAKVASSADDPVALEELLTILPKDQHALKLMELDNEGYTPLHYAIRLGNVAMAKTILAHLDEQQRKDVILHPNSDNQDKTVLHYACEFCNGNMLEQLLNTLGPRNLYEFCVHSFDTLEKLVATNPHLSDYPFKQRVKSLTKLFDCFHYLENKYEPKNEKYLSRLNDFQACWMSIATSPVGLYKLPSPIFLKSHHVKFFPAREGYKTLRSRLVGITEREVREFKEFINEKSYVALGKEGASQESAISTVIARKLCGVNVPGEIASASPPPYAPPETHPEWEEKFGYKIPIAYPVKRR